MHAASTVDGDGKCLKDTPASMDRMTDGCFRKFSDRKLKKLYFDSSLEDFYFNCGKPSTWSGHSSRVSHDSHFQKIK